MNKKDSRDDEKIRALIRGSVDGSDLSAETKERMLEGIRRKTAAEGETENCVPSAKRSGFVRIAVPAAACLALIASVLLVLHVSRGGSEIIENELTPEMAGPGEGTEYAQGQERAEAVTSERATEKVPAAEASGRPCPDTDVPEAASLPAETNAPDPVPDDPENTWADSEAPGQKGAHETSLPSGREATMPAGDGTDGSPNVSESAGDRLVLSIPDHQCFLMQNEETANVGTGISDAEAGEFFKRNLTGITDTLVQSGAAVTDLHFSERGYCHITLGSGTEAPVIMLDTRTYLAYSGEKLIALVDLVRRDGTISWEILSGAEWFDAFDRFLSEYRGQKIAFAYIDGTEIAISPFGEYFCPSEPGDHTGILGIFSPYVYICRYSNAVFVP
ncbi:MAG: hypothetical protein J5933_04810 [Clostridia bacterium]|nr:hypothetical protein [Clostridia bacterium]